MKDKQMMERARELGYTECLCADLRVLSPNDPTCMMHKVAQALLQVRKEAIEETLKQIFDYSIAHGTTLLTSLSAITAITNHALNQESWGDGGKGE